jgi:hypothetical protein
MASKVASTDIAILAALADEGDIAAHVDSLDKDAVPELLARAAPYRKAVAFIEKCGEQRIVGEGILGMGERWTDPLTGVIHVFAGLPGDNECKDPDALRAALLAATVPQAEIDRAIYPAMKVDFRVLKEIGKRSTAAQEAIDDHVTRKPFGPPHLKEAK